MNHGREEVSVLIREKRFLGQEFLTWLWWKSETGGGRVSAGGEELGVSFERFILLEDGDPDSPSSLISRGRDADLADAKAGLLQGKKVAKAHLRLGRDGEEWRLTLSAAAFDVSSCRVPKTVSEEEGMLDYAGRVMERVMLLEKGMDVLNLLFELFLSLRLDRGRWEREKRGFRSWVAGE